MTPDVLNIYAVADRVKLEPSSVRRLATHLGVGRKLAKRGWWFTEEDVIVLLQRPDGRGKWQQNGGRRRFLEAQKRVAVSA